MKEFIKPQFDARSEGGGGKKEKKIDVKEFLEKLKDFFDARRTIEEIDKLTQWREMHEKGEIDYWHDEAIRRLDKKDQERFEKARKLIYSYTEGNFGGQALISAFHALNAPEIDLYKNGSWPHSMKITSEGVFVARGGGYEGEVDYYGLNKIDTKEALKLLQQAKKEKTAIINLLSKHLEDIKKAEEELKQQK